MRKILLTSIVIFGVSLQANQVVAQLLSVGESDALTIMEGTEFSVDKLVMVPSKPYTIRNNSISVVGTPANKQITAISKMYHFAQAPQMFSGKLGISYSAEDRKRVDENEMQFLIQDAQNWSTTPIQQTMQSKQWVETATLMATVPRNITLGTPQSGDFDVLENPVQGHQLKIWVYKPLTLQLYNAEGKLLSTNSYAPGLQTISVQMHRHASYLVSSGSTTRRFIL